MLVKPGIIRGNAITAIAGFLFASKGDVDFGLLFALVFGVSAVMASACVFNNYLDRDIDRKMKRTKDRALAAGKIPVLNAMVYAIFLAVLGFVALAVYTNSLTVLIGFVGFIDYVVLYGISKRKSVHGTLVGSISGATPPVAGYTAVTNQFDLAALLLFAILVAWQMPHFYAIAIYRIKDYKSANIPVLPLINGIKTTKVQMIAYMIAFIIATVLLTVLEYASYTYLVVMTLVGLAWLRIGLLGINSSNDEKWAKQVFGFSLYVLLIFSVLISFDVALP